MKIYIYPCKSIYELEMQAEILTSELEKMGHHCEWSRQTHPARFFLNKYDILHMLIDELPLSFKNFCILTAAKSLNIPVVGTLYGSVHSTLFSKFQIKYLDAISVSETRHMQYIRFYSQTKFIWPPLINYPIKKFQKKNTITILKQDSALIFHLSNGFEELPPHKWLLQEATLNKSINISSDPKACVYSYINATEVYKSKTASEIQKKWDRFVYKNPNYKNTILIVNKQDLENVIKEKRSLFFINYLNLHSLKLIDLFQMCLTHQSLIILNESQASGIPELWIHQKNGIIYNYNKSFLYHLSLLELLEASEKICFSMLDSQVFDSKLNELSRIYGKIKQQKDLRISYANMSRRS